MNKNEKQNILRRIKSKKYRLRTNIEINSKGTLSTNQTSSKYLRNGSLPYSFLSSNEENVDTLINQSKANINHSINLNLPKINNSQERVLSPIKAPSCITSKNELSKKDDFMYKQMFRKVVQEKDVPIDNLFNIIFAESEHEFASHCGKIYRQEKSKGRLLVRNPANKYLQVQLKEMNKKMFFIKGILNFVFPGIIVKKIEEECKQLRRNNKLNKEKAFLPPYERVDENLLKQKIMESDYLTKSLLIMNKSNSAPNICNLK